MTTGNAGVHMSVANLGTAVWMAIVPISRAVTGTTLGGRVPTWVMQALSTAGRGRPEVCRRPLCDPGAYHRTGLRPPIVMTHVDIAARLIQPAGHHRQPRSSASWITLAGGSSFESPSGSFVNATAAAVPDAQFVFWSASDGTNGQTTASTTIHQQVGSATLAVTAWYLPVGGNGLPGPSGYLLDAFSVAHGDFIDDNFVDVTSDASLTSDANVVGWVPTVRTQILDAHGSVSTTSESFERWIGVPASDRTATALEGSSGFGIASYRKAEVTIPNVQVPKEAWLVFGGIAVDGGGFVIPIGGGGGGGPVGPWGPFMERFSRAYAAGALAAGISGAAGKDIQVQAANEIAAAAKANVAAVKKQLG